MKASETGDSLCETLWVVAFISIELLPDGGLISARLFWNGVEGSIGRIFGTDC